MLILEIFGILRGRRWVKNMAFRIASGFLSLEVEIRIKFCGRLFWGIVIISFSQMLGHRVRPHCSFEVRSGHMIYFGQ